MKFCENPGCKHHIEVSEEVARIGVMEFSCSDISPGVFIRNLVRREELSFVVDPPTEQHDVRGVRSVWLCGDCKELGAWLVAWVNECVAERDKYRKQRGKAR